MELKNHSFMSKEPLMARVPHVAGPCVVLAIRSYITGGNIVDKLMEKTFF